jgi:hypothetical protein
MLQLHVVFFGMLAKSVFRWTGGRSRFNLHLEFPYTIKSFLKSFKFANNGNNMAVGADGSLKRAIVFKDFAPISDFLGRAAKGVVAARGPCRIDMNGNGHIIAPPFIIVHSERVEHYREKDGKFYPAQQVVMVYFSRFTITQGGGVDIPAAYDKSRVVKKHLGVLNVMLINCMKLHALAYIEACPRRPRVRKIDVAAGRAEALAEIARQDPPGDPSSVRALALALATLPANVIIPPVMLPPILEEVGSLAMVLEIDGDGNPDPTLVKILAVIPGVDPEITASIEVQLYVLTGRSRKGPYRPRWLRTKTNDEEPPLHLEVEGNPPRDLLGPVKQLIYQHTVTLRNVKLSSSGHLSNFDSREYDVVDWVGLVRGATEIIDWVPRDGPELVDIEGEIEGVEAEGEHIDDQSTQYGDEMPNFHAQCNFLPAACCLLPAACCLPYHVP